MQLDGKVALVTGGAQGIGKSIALKLASHGADIALCDINEQAMERTAQEITSLGRKSSIYKVNVSQSNEVSECVNKILDSMKKIDILCNNAGITRDTLLVRMKDEDWDLVMKINLYGTFYFTRSVAKYMMRQRSGKIVNIASIIGLIGNIGQANYGASKAGVIGLTKSAARELAPRGIQVNAVAPGFIKTAMTDKIPDEIKEKMIANIPLGTLGVPEDVANVVSFLASPMANYITGQVINICGGMVM